MAPSQTNPSQSTVPAREAYLVLREIRCALAALSSVHDLARWSQDYADGSDGADDARALGRMVGHIDRHNGDAMERLAMAEHRLGRAIGPENVTDWDAQARIASGATDARSYF
jgi:hypothetical protein